MYNGFCKALRVPWKVHYKADPPSSSLLLKTENLQRENEKLYLLPLRTELRLASGDLIFLDLQFLLHTQQQLVIMALKLSVLICSWWAGTRWGIKSLGANEWANHWHSSQTTFEPPGIICVDNFFECKINFALKTPGLNPFLIFTKSYFFQSKNIWIKQQIQTTLSFTRSVLRETPHTHFN